MWTAFWQSDCFASIIKFSQRNPELEIVEMRSGYGLNRKMPSNSKENPDGRKWPPSCVNRHKVNVHEDQRLNLTSFQIIHHLN